MAKKGTGIFKAFYLRPWAIREDVLLAMHEIAQRYIRGEKLSEDEIQVAASSRKKKAEADYEVSNGVAKIPIMGIIEKRASMVNNISQPQGTSVEEIKRNLRAAIKDKDVESIAFEIDSPGGSVDGVFELADFIFAQRGKKKMIAYADGQMASAAYAIGSSADQIFTTKSSEVGSIGVYAAIADYTVLYHNAGVKVDIVKAGKNKASGHPLKPFTEEDRRVIQSRIDEYYGLFVDGVARNRGLSKSEALEIATGEVFIGQRAVDLKLADGIDEIDSVFEDSQSKSVRSEETPPNTKGKPAAAQPEQTQNLKQNSEEEEDMDFKTLTLEQIQSNCPDIFNSILESGKEDFVKAGVESERNRVKGILEVARKKEYKDLSALAYVAIEDGDSAEEAEKSMKAGRLALINQESAASPGADEEEALDPKKLSKEKLESMTPEERADHDWENEANIREEFTSKESYAAFLRAKAKGKTKIYSKK